MAARTDRENDLAPPSKVREYFLLAKCDWRGTYSQVADETWRSNAKAKTTIMSNLYEIHTRPFKTGNPTGITFKPTLDLPGYHPSPLKNGTCMRPRLYVEVMMWGGSRILHSTGRGGGEETRTHSVDSSIVYALIDPCFRVEMKDPSFGC